MSEKKFLKKQPRLEDTVVSYAFVLNGPLRDFSDIRNYIRNFTDSHIIYQTKSVEKLYISKTESEEA